MRSTPPPPPRVTSTPSHQPQPIRSTTTSYQQPAAAIPPASTLNQHNHHNHHDEEVAAVRMSLAGVWKDPFPSEVLRNILSFTEPACEEWHMMPFLPLDMNLPIFPYDDYHFYRPDVEVVNYRSGRSSSMSSRSSTRSSSHSIYMRIHSRWQTTSYTARKTIGGWRSC